MDFLSGVAATHKKAVASTHKKAAKKAGKKGGREFDWSKHQMERVCLKIAYVGKEAVSITVAVTLSEERSKFFKNFVRYGFVVSVSDSDPDSLIM